MSLDKLPDHPEFPEFLWVPLLQPWGPAHPGRLKTETQVRGGAQAAGAVWGPCQPFSPACPPGHPGCSCAPWPSSTGQFFLGQHRPQGD